MGAGVVVAGAIIDVRGRVLAARRTSPPELAGGWELPGGKVEPGESEPAALGRELTEELGVVADIGERIPGEWPLADGWLLRVYLARITSGTPQPGEAHDALTWVAPDEAASFPWLAADRPAVALLSRQSQP
jgi:8-oxo-dGTP diphosphatase